MSRLQKIKLKNRAGILSFLNKISNLGGEN